MSMYTEDPIHRHYLGEEFLTWLWYRCEREGGEFELPGPGGAPRIFGIAFDDFLVLRADERSASEAGMVDEDLFETVESVLRKGSPSKTAEAGVALLRGKKLARARLLVSDGNEQWSLVLDGTEMCMRSVKTPKPDSEDEREREQQSLNDLFDLSDLLDHIYGRFLEQRLGPSFRAEVVPRMGEWMIEKAHMGEDEAES